MQYTEHPIVHMSSWSKYLNKLFIFLKGARNYELDKKIVAKTNYPFRESRRKSKADTLQKRFLLFIIITTLWLNPTLKSIKSLLALKFTKLELIVQRCEMWHSAVSYLSVS